MPNSVRRVVVTFEHTRENMKKVLLTSTALVAFAGAASAEVALSGSAEMGIVGGKDRETAFSHNIDVVFTLTGESDAGFVFGASVDLDEADGIDLPETANQGTAVFISGNFGTVTLGDTDGAMDRVLQEANIGDPGSINDAQTVHAGYLGSYHDGAGLYDGQILRYDYGAGGFNLSFSLEQGRGTATTDPVGTLDIAYALGLNYVIDIAGGAVRLAAAWDKRDSDANPLCGTGGTVKCNSSADIWAIGASINLDSGFVAALTYTDGDLLFVEESSHIGLGIGYSFDAVSLHANYGQYDFGNGTKADGYGLSVGYDLGGGADVLFGWGEGTNAAGVKDDLWSLGLAFAF